MFAFRQIVIGACLLAACNRSTVVVVTATASTPLAGVVTIRTQQGFAGQTHSHNFSTGAALSLPPSRTFGFDLPGSQGGNFEIFVHAIDKNGVILGQGGASLVVAAGKRNDLAVTLDFQPCGVVGQSTDFAAVGKGTVAAPYVICNADQLVSLSYSSAGWVSSFLLAGSLDLSAFGPTSAKPMQRIGTGAVPFSGTFDGAHYSISNLTLQAPGQSDVGLFGEICGSAAAVRNLSLLNANVSGKDNTGILAGTLDGGTISNVSVQGAVSGGDLVGGAIGQVINGAVVSTVAAAVTVQGGEQQGGLAGVIEDSFAINTLATGSVTGSANIGGLVGSVNGASLLDSYAAGDASGDANVGGFVGSGVYVYALNDFASGGVTANNTNAGRFDGGVSGTYENCYVWQGSSCETDASCLDLSAGEQAVASTATFSDPSQNPLSTWDFTNVWVAGAPPTLAPKPFDATSWGSCAAHMTDQPFAGGVGTVESPYLICAPSQLTNLANAQSFWIGHAFSLMSDLDMQGEATDGFPIGNSGKTATLIFDGNGKTISNFSYDGDQDKQYAGLLGTANAVVRRLGMKNVDIEGTNAQIAGPIAGYLFRGAVVDFYASGTVSVDNGQVGGIIGGGASGAPVISSYATGNFTGAEAAGISGDIVQDCFAAANVNATDAARGGPLSTYYSGVCSALEGGDIVVDGFYVDDQTATCTNCCTPQPYGTGEAHDYFFGPGHSQPPLDMWDFVHVWSAQAGGYPLLQE